MDYNGVPWWRGATDRSTVYTSAEAPYLFPQYVQNLVSWQPLGRLVAAGTDTEYDEIIGEPADMPIFEHEADRVVNSKYWTRYTKGGQNLSDLESYENWGTDTVEQLAGGSVTLWFTSGSMENWNAETLTYTDGNNSVKVSCVTADKITLKFGDDGSDQFATLSSVGVFADFTSQKIFEESGKGLLASM